MLFRSGRGKNPGIRLVQRHALTFLLRQSLVKKAQHRRTDIDNIGLQAWIDSEKTFQESAVSITKNQCLPRICQRGQKVEAATLQCPSKGQIFQPAVGSCQQVEIQTAAHRIHAAKNRGVSNTASTATRSCITVKCLLRASPRSSSAAIADAR